MPYLEHILILQGSPEEGRYIHNVGFTAFNSPLPKTTEPKCSIQEKIKKDGCKRPLTFRRPYMLWEQKNAPLGNVKSTEREDTESSFPTAVRITSLQAMRSATWEQGESKSTERMRTARHAKGREKIKSRTTGYSTAATSFTAA